MVHLWAQDLGGMNAVTGQYLGTGLLAGVLGWLLFVYLPSKDKQLADLIANKDKLVETQLTSFRDELALERKSNNDNIVRQQKQDLDIWTKQADLLLQNTQQTQALAAVVGNLAERVNMTNTHPPSVLPGGLPARPGGT
jgi:polyhydroxyalkanoate synthesis regulator phasin